MKIENRFKILENEWSANERCPNELWEDIKKTFTEVADETLGRAKKKTNKPYISDEVRMLAKEKSQARRENKKDEYKRLKREIRQKIRRDKNNWLQQECSKITTANAERKSKEVYNQIRKVTSSSFKPQNAAINNEMGETLTETEEILNRWHEYGQELFKNGHNRESMQNESDNLQHQDPEPKPLLSEVRAAVNQLKTGKSPGLDNIPSELLKHSGEAGIHMIYKLCCQIWMTRKWPNDWKTQEFVMLHKNGSIKECSNY